MSINRYIATGNLTREPELKMSGQGKQVMKMCVAVEDARKNPSSGQWEKHTNFINCVGFGPRAEGWARSLRKGAKVSIEGHLHYSSWKKDDGSVHSKIEVYLEKVEFLSRPMQQVEADAAEGSSACSDDTEIAAGAYQDEELYAYDVDF